MTLKLKFKTQLLRTNTSCEERYKQNFLLEIQKLQKTLVGRRLLLSHYLVILFAHYIRSHSCDFTWCRNIDAVRMQIDAAVLDMVQRIIIQMLRWIKW